MSSATAACPSNGRQYGSLKHPSKAHARLQVSCPWQAQRPMVQLRSGSGACRGWSVGSLGGRKISENDSLISKISDLSRQ